MDVNSLRLSIMLTRNGVALPQKVAGSSQPSDGVHGDVPDYNWHETIVRDSCDSKQNAESQSGEDSAATLVEMSQTEDNR